MRALHPILPALRGCISNEGNYQMTIEREQFWQTRYRGDNDSEYQIYLTCANNGKGGDITRNGAPHKTYEEWINS